MKGQLEQNGDNFSETDVLLRMIRTREKQLQAQKNPPGISPEKIRSLVDSVIAEHRETVLNFPGKTASPVPKKTSAGKIWAPVGIAALLLVAAGAVFLSRQFKGAGAEMIVAYGSVLKNEAAAKAGAAFAKGDSLATKDKSLIVLKWDNAAVAVASQNGKFKIRDSAYVDGKPVIEWDNLEGLVFGKITPNQALYKVHTPMAMITVKGTSFGVRASADGTTIGVLSGTVSAELSESFLQTIADKARREKLSQVILIGPGQQLNIPRSGADFAVAPLPAEEEKYLLQFEKIAAAGGGTPEAFGEIFDFENAERNRKGRGPEAVVKLTLAEIAKKYGKIAKINLNNGKSYIGAFKMKGNEIEIYTPNGTFRFPAKQLANVQSPD